MELKGSYYLRKFNPEGHFYEKLTLLFDLELYVIVVFSLPLTRVSGRENRVNGFLPPHTSHISP